MKFVNLVGVFSLVTGSVVCAGEKDVSVNSNVGFHDKAIIAEKIKSECTNLGVNLSKSTKKYLEGLGWEVSLSEDLESVKEGKTIKLEIMNAVSSGNAFTGHHKSVSISATLYNDGKEMDSYSGTRDSGGGFMGGFKGSCAVLYRCVNTLGNDVAKWADNK